MSSSLYFATLPGLSAGQLNLDKSYHPALVCHLHRCGASFFALDDVAFVEGKDACKIAMEGNVGFDVVEIWKIGIILLVGRIDQIIMAGSVEADTDSVLPFDFNLVFVEAILSFMGAIESSPLRNSTAFLA